jgi:hypothetical protein
MSGASGERLSPSTASPMISSLRMNWIRLPMPKIAIAVVPVSMLLTASPPPLNGTRTKSVPCLRLNSSMNATFESEGAM